MTPRPRRALHVSHSHNTIDGDVRLNPVGLWAMSVPDLIAQMVRLVSGDGVVLINPSAAAQLGLPIDELPTGPDSKQHPVAMVLRAHGWTVKDVHRWFHVKHRDYGRAWIGLTGFFEGGHFPLVDTPDRTTAALAHWHNITGHAWTGSAGDAGNEILRQITYTTRRNGVDRRPEFWSWAGPQLPSQDPQKPRYPAETWYVPSQWRRPVFDDVTVITALDRVRAYLAACTCLTVAAEPLDHTPRKILYDPHLAGWYRVRLGSWDLDHLMPDPAGYPSRTSAADDRERWITHPRLALLHELAADGLYEYDVLDSWTAPATPVIKTYGQTLRMAWQAARLIQDPDISRLVRTGVKEAYRQAHGHWRSKNSSVQRPDWASALVAVNAANTWRAAWKLGQAGGTFAGPWPVQIDTDSLYYPGEAGDVTHAAQLAGWTVWDGQREDLDNVTELGHWRTGRTLPYDPTEGRPIRQETNAA